VMSLTTPDKIRTLQRKLHLKAKAEPNFRLYLLYDKVYRADILRHAYDLTRANKGAPGVDGVDFAAIEAAGLESWLDGIETELRTKTYQPQPVRRVMIPKPAGGERPLGIPADLQIMESNQPLAQFTNANLGLKASNVRHRPSH
jgi:RNA-directed DNA polymerase